MITTDSPKFIFIESNTSGTGELLLHKALEKKLVPVFITKETKKYNFLPIKNVKVIVLDTTNKKKLLKYLSTLSNIQGIYSSSEYFIETAAWLAKKLKLPHTNQQTIETCRNKYALYKILSEKNILIAKTAYINDIEQAEEIINSWFFPIVIKPNAGSGSVGAKLCCSEKDAKEHIRFLFKSGHFEILIQEYIDGQEYSAETCSFNNRHHILGITKKYLSAPPYFIEAGHDFPAVLSQSEEEVILSTVKKLLSLLNFNFGFSHMEFKLIKGKVYIIEVNPRLAGGMIPILIQKAKGFDVLNLLLGLYTGQAVNIKMAYNKFASIRHFIGNQSGKIKNCSYNKFLSYDVKLIKKEGEYFLPRGDFRDRLAYLIVSDNSAEICKRKADEAIKEIVVTLED